MQFLIHISKLRIVTLLVVWFFSLQLSEAIESREISDLIENSDTPPSLSLNIIVTSRSSLDRRVKFCWMANSTNEGRRPRHASTDRDVCWAIEKYTIKTSTSVGHHFSGSITTTTQEGVTTDGFNFEIVGGKIIYDLDVIAEHAKASLSPSMPGSIPKVGKRGLRVVHVRTPDRCQVNAWKSFGAVWRDAIRRAAFRRNVALCMCGGFNHTSTYTVTKPNPELPYIANSLDAGGACNCRRSPTDFYYDMWYPCEAEKGDTIALVTAETCSFDLEHKGRPISDTANASMIYSTKRLGMLHTTATDDALTMKDKMWNGLLSTYGFDRASAIMPTSFYTTNSSQQDRLLTYCKEMASHPKKNRYLIVKNANLHRQQGISLAMTDDFVAAAAATAETGGTTSNLKKFSFVTEFLPSPFLVDGYKINMRKYVLLVCIGGRLRGYVHEDGKNFFTPRPYREPWEVQPASQGAGMGTGVGMGAGDEALLKSRLEELVTTT